MKQWTLAALLLCTAMGTSQFVLASTNNSNDYLEAAAALEAGEPYPAFLKAVAGSRSNDPGAMALVAKAYLFGQGTIKHYATAVTHYEKAAALNYPPAQFALARLLEVGLGAKQDPERAAKLMLSAADQGLAWAMFSIAMYFENGTGVTKDIQSAYKWYSLAADFLPMGNDGLGKEAGTKRDSLLQSLSPTQKTDAEREIRAWKRVKRTIDPNWTRKASELPSLESEIAALRNAQSRPPAPKDPRDSLSSTYFPKNN